MVASVDHLVIYAVRVTSTTHGGPDIRIIDGLALVSNFACAFRLTSVPCCCCLCTAPRVLQVTDCVWVL